MHRTLRYTANRLPALATGLYVSRIVREWLQGGFVGALVATILVCAGAIWLLRKFSLHRTWPASFLLAYVFFPRPAPPVAFWTAVFVLLVCAYAFLQYRQSQRDAANSAPARVRAWLPSVLLVAFLILYVGTLAPGVLPADSGEFQLVTATLGVAHPPGFPLYTLLGHFFTRLPLGATAAVQINLFSALTSAATLALVSLCVYRLTDSIWGSVTAAVALGTATTFWAQATTANIRSLTGLFAAAAFYTLILYHEQVNAGRRPAEAGKPAPKSSRLPNFLTPLRAFALAIGFGLTHHLSLAFMAVIMGLFILWIDPDLFLLKRPRRLAVALAAGLVGFLPWLYLPWREASLRKGTKFIRYVLGLDFGGDFFYFNTAGALWQRLGVMFNVLTFQFNAVLLIGMLVGCLLLLRHKPKLAFLLGGAFGLHTLVTATYRAPQTVEYMLPAYVPLAICLGYTGSLAHSPARSRPLNSLTFLLPHVLIPLLLTAALFQTASHYPSFAQLHAATDTADYTNQLLAEAPPNSVILADWHWATPLWYLQQIEGRRPDVEIEFVFPRTASYAADWQQRIAQEVTRGRPVVATHYAENAYGTLPPPRPLGEAFLFPQTAQTALPNEFTASDISLDGKIEITGYKLSRSDVQIGRETTLTLAWQPTTKVGTSVTLFAHLVGFDGRIYAQQDVSAAPQPEGLTLTQLRLTPRYGATPGDFALLVGAYTAEGANLLNTAGEERTQIAPVPVKPMSTRPFTQNPAHRPLIGTDQTLIGYDWDNTLPGRTRLYLHWQRPDGYWSEVHDLRPGAAFTLPPHYGVWGIPVRNVTIQNTGGHYIPLGRGIVWTGSTPSISSLQAPISGEDIQLTQTFQATRPILRDIGVSVRLLGFEEDGFTWAWRTADEEDSDIPALGGIPTLKWIAGSEVHHPRTLTVDARAYPGQQIGGMVRLYDAFTGRPLPILDERIAASEQPWIPLGTAEIGNRIER